ncbi:MAG: hypothetical protein Kow0074_21520 [Candidatus Zixiibacteriota bacterium]
MNAAYIRSVKMPAKPFAVCGKHPSFRDQVPPTVGPATRMRHVAGFTLVEIVITMLVVGIMAAVAIPVVGSFIASSRETATRDEMRLLARAIAGSDDADDRGFEGDVGYPPSQLSDLVNKPDSVPAWDPFLNVGWNGPYVDSTQSEYLTDAWGSAYVYDPDARTIVSNGSGSAITVTF